VCALTQSVHSTDNMNARMQVGRRTYGSFYADPEEIIAMREGQELIEQDDGFMVPLFRNGDIVEVDEHNYKELWHIMQVDGYDPLLYTWRDLPNVGGRPWVDFPGRMWDEPLWQQIIASNKHIFMPSEQEIWMMPKMFVAPPKVDSPYCCPVVLYCEEGEVRFQCKACV
jgi:hypothetical protein